MAEPQKRPGEDILERLRSTLGQKVPVPSEPSPQRRRRGPFTDGRDILARLQAARPSRASRFVSTVVDGVVSLGVNVKDSAVNLLKSAGTVTLMPMYVTMLALEAVADEGSIPEKAATQSIIDIQRLAGSPAEVEERLLGGAIDVGLVGAGLGLGAVAAPAAAAGATGTSIVAGGFGRQLLRSAGRRAIQGTKAGLILSPAITSPEVRRAPLGEQLLERGVDVGTFAAFEVVLVGPLAAGFNKIVRSKPVRAVVEKLQERARHRTAKAITEEVIKASEPSTKIIEGVKVKGTGLTAGQYLRNTVPRALNRLGQTADLMAAAKRDLTINVARAMEAVIAPPTTPFTRTITRTAARIFKGKARTTKVVAQAVAGGRVRTSLIKAAEPVEQLAPALRSAVSEELAFAEGVMSGFVKKLSRDKSAIDTKMLKTLVQQTRKLKDTIITGRTPVKSINDIVAIERNLDLLHRQWLLAYNEVFTEGPLRLWVNAARRLVRGKPEAGDMRALVVNMFGPFSFVQDSLGNSTRLGTKQVVSRALGDTMDLVLGRATAGQRTASFVNALRNYNDARPFAREIAKGRFAAGIEVGETTAAGLAERTLENVLFVGVKGKGLVDTAARRSTIIFKAHDIAFKEAAAKGLTGVERQVYIQQRLAGPWSGREQFQLLRSGNRAAFIEPRGPTAIKFIEHPATQLFISPFVGFGLAWAKFIAELVPGLGTVPTMAKFLRTGRVSQSALEQVLAKQLVGTGAVVAADRTLYDQTDFDNPSGLLYRDLMTGEEQLLQSPLTDFLMIDAIMRGDWGNAAKAAPNTGMVLLGGGLATRMTKLLLEDPSESNMKRAGGEVAKMLDLAFPGRAVALAFADYFGPGLQREPFTEGGIPIPPAIGGLTGLGRRRIGAAGQAVAARRRPALPLPSVTLRRDSFIGKALAELGLEPEFPASFGTSVTVRDMTDTDRFMEKARRNFGVKMDIRRASPVRSRGGWGRRVPADQLPDEVTRFYMVKKGEFVAAQLAPNVDNPAVWSLSQDDFINYKNLWLSNAAQYAANQTLKQFPNLTAEGLLEPVPDLMVNPLTRQIAEPEE